VVSGDFFHVIGSMPGAQRFSSVMGWGTVYGALLQELSPIADDPGEIMRLLNSEIRQSSSRRAE
jgi:hypothetical protein